ncbi:MAG: TetR/AcrR family transcriptional regulator [Candidatus Nanopelagicales bacterium]
MGRQNGKPGRPRDPHADEAILEAARDLLAEGGLANLTVEGTAQRAGVAKTTVYRRYPTKLDLAVAAVAVLVSGGGPESDSVENGVREGSELFQKAFGPRGSQAAYLAVAAAAATNPEVHERFTRDVLTPVSNDIEAMVHDARERGHARHDASADFIYDVIMGTLVHRYIIRQLPADAEFLEHLTSLTWYLYQGCPRDEGSAE